MNARSSNGIFYREVERIDYNYGTMETLRCACTYAVNSNGKPYVKVLQWGEILAVRPLAEDEILYLGLGIEQ